MMFRRLNPLTFLREVSLNMKALIDYRIAKHFLLFNLIILTLFTFCIVDSSFADEKDIEDFPWEVFYPAFIKN